MRCVCARAGKFGSSAAVGQVLPPKPQMLGKQDWRYVSGGGQHVHGAHAADCDITSLAFLRDSHTMLSRGADATLKACAHLHARGTKDTYIVLYLGRVWSIRRTSRLHCLHALVKILELLSTLAQVGPALKICKSAELNLCVMVF